MASFEQFSTSFLVATYSVGRFGDAVVSGNWILNGFFDSVQSLSASVLAFSQKAFKEASEIEVDRIAGGGAIGAGFDGKLDFGQGLQVFDTVRTKLAGIAAELPGVTSEYTKAAALLGDDIAGALNNGTRSAAQLKEAFETRTPELIKNLVLNSKLYGQDIPLSAITRSFSKLLDTGKVTNREIFFQRNPLLKAQIAKYEKENSKLTKLSKDDRLVALNEIFSKTFTPEQLAMLQNAFSTKVEALRSAFLDPDVGLLGFNRKIKNQDGEETTFFGILATAAAPFVDALTDAAKLLTQFADPLQALGALVEKYVSPQIKEFSLNILRGMDTFAFSTKDFGPRFIESFKDAFDIDLTQVDFAAEITKFFDGIANFILNFGAGSKMTGNAKLDAAIDALLNGIFKVIGAFATRLFNEFLKDPMGFVKVAFVFNPTAVLAFAAVLAALVPVIVGIIGAFGTIGILGLAAVAVIVIFKDQIAEWSRAAGAFFFKTFAQLENTISLIGNAGTKLVEGILSIAKGDWLKGIPQLIESLGSAMLANVPIIIELADKAFKGVAEVIVNIFKGIPNAIKGVVDPVIDAVPGGRQISQAAQFIPGPGVLAAPDLIYKGAKKIFGFAQGNAFGSLVSGFLSERQAMPGGAEVVFANSSEAIIPRPQALSMMAQTSSGATINMTINNYSGEDIQAKVISALESILG